MALTNGELKALLITAFPETDIDHDDIEQAIVIINTEHSGIHIRSCILEALPGVREFMDCGLLATAIQIISHSGAHIAAGATHVHMEEDRESAIEAMLRAAEEITRHAQENEDKDNPETD